ncbi:Rha family transcriptional regulator [Leclercia adecarboxylata]|nr:Rha family transcriptional regulator [Leclercia adecarboxylata]QNP36194.1 Rha family transcriptional regulator [Leclercia adecarboxylata]
MSSREIAELTGKRHPDVKRDIEVMLEQLSEDASSFAHIYFDTMNRQQTEYHLDRRHVECLLTGYSASLRMKVIDRLHEREAGTSSAPAPLSQNEIIAAIAMANVEQDKRIHALEQQVDDMAQGAIPAGYQGYSYLAEKTGLSDKKCRQLVSAYEVSHKTVPHVAPTGAVTRMTVIHEHEFMDAFSGMIAETEIRGSFHHHVKMGRFMLAGEVRS